MIYTHLSSKDRETGAETRFFSCCKDISIVCIPECDVCDSALLPPTLLIAALAPGCPPRQLCHLAVTERDNVR